MGRLAARRLHDAVEGDELGNDQPCHHLPPSIDASVLPPLGGRNSSQPLPQSKRRLSSHPPRSTRGAPTPTPRTRPPETRPRRARAPDRPTCRAGSPSSRSITATCAPIDRPERSRCTPRRTRRHRRRLRKRGPCDGTRLGLPAPTLWLCKRRDRKAWPCGRSASMAGAVERTVRTLRPDPLRIRTGQWRVGR
jgi:hypothetical protein